jgi:hypothetical protein
MNDHEPSAPGWRRWFRYRLSTLLIAITLATIAFAWCRSQMVEARRQRELAVAVEAAGGLFYYDWENHTPRDHSWRFGVTSSSPTRQGSPSGPKWLREWIGDEYFQEIVEVDLDIPMPFMVNLIPTVGSDGNETLDENEDAKTIVPGDPPDDDDYGPSHKKCPIGIDAKWA